jgi:hypothetical protein
MASNGVHHYWLSTFGFWERNGGGGQFLKGEEMGAGWQLCPVQRRRPEGSHNTTTGSRAAATSR